jgi:hypothetical protein
MYFDPHQGSATVTVPVSGPFLSEVCKYLNHLLVLVVVVVEAKGEPTFML